MKLHDLKLIGLALYLGEGTKLRKDKRYKNTFHYNIEFTNSNPRIIRIFIKFLRKILIIEESKLRCELFIYDDLKRISLEKYWSRLTKIPLNNFNKTIILKPKIYKNKLSLKGTCKIRYCDKTGFLKLNELIIKNIGNSFSLIQ